MDELVKKAIESTDHRWTFFENFSNGEQATPLARAKFEKRYLLKQMRRYHFKIDRPKLYKYVNFLNEMIKELKKHEETAVPPDREHKTDI